MASSRAGAGVAPQEREQVVAEVESHVTDTGEGPVDAFGPPGVYAAQYPEGPARLDGNATRPCPHLVVPHLVVPHLVVPLLVVPPPRRAPSDRECFVQESWAKHSRSRGRARRERGSGGERRSVIWSAP